MLNNILIGLAMGGGYLVVYALVKYLRATHGVSPMRTSEARGGPQRRPSMAPEPSLDLVTPDELLFTAAELIRDLQAGGVFNASSIGDAVDWLYGYDHRDVDRLDKTELLKRAYDVINGVKVVHEATTNLDAMQEARVHGWLRQYAGARGNR